MIYAGRANPNSRSDISITEICSASCFYGKMASPSLGSSNPEKPSNGLFSLENILGDHENLEHPKYKEADKPVGGWVEEAADLDRPAADGFCIECEGIPSFCCTGHGMLAEIYDVDQPAKMFCENCSDNYCEVCFAAQHRKGSRKGHVMKLLDGKSSKKAKENGSAQVEGENGDSVNTSARY